MATAPFGNRTVLAIVGVAGTMTLLIHFIVFPPHAHMFLRDWGLHFFAVVASCLACGLVLGHKAEGKAADVRRRHRLACLVPFVFLFLHEVGQWLWPDGARDHFDSVRDALLNAAGAFVAWKVLRRGRTIDDEPARRRSATTP
ncbi:MAG: hypothetical protein WAT39_01580 [Planctomycetota bacterium]